MKQLHKLLPVLLITLLPACADIADTLDTDGEEPPLTPPPNEKILFEASITRTNDVVVVDVVLRDTRNDNASITIEADESLHLSSGGADTELMAENVSSVCNTSFGWTFCSEVHYRARIDAVALLSDRLQIKYLRPNFGDASDTSVNMPVAVELLAPLADEEFSRSTQAISVSWNNPNTGQFVDVQAFGYVNELAGDYFQYDAYNNADSGIHVIAGKLIQPSSNAIADQDVRLTIYVSRSASGSVDSGYAGGSIRAVNQSAVTVNSLP